MLPKLYEKNRKIRRLIFAIAWSFAWGYIAVQSADETCALVLLAAGPLVFLNDRPMRFRAFHYIIFAMTAVMLLSGFVNCGFATGPYMYDFRSLQDGGFFAFLASVIGDLYVPHVPSGYGLGYTISHVGVWWMVIAYTARAYTRDEVRLVADTYVVAAVAFALCLFASNWQLWKLFEIERGELPFLFGTTNANFVSYIVAPMSIICFVRIHIRFDWQQLAFCLSGVLALLICRSRGAMIGFAIGFVVACAYLCVKLKRKKPFFIELAAILSAFVVCVVTLRFAAPDLFYGIFRPHSLDNDARVRMWREGLSYLRSPSDWIFGKGWGYYYYRHQGDPVAWYGMHNFFVQYLVNSGLVAVILAAAVYVWFFLRTFDPFVVAVMAAPVLHLMLEDGMGSVNFVLMILCYVCAASALRTGRSAVWYFMDRKTQSVFDERVEPIRTPPSWWRTAVGSR